MKTLLVIEGPDRVGKTTVVKQLLQDPDFRSYRSLHTPWVTLKDMEWGERYLNLDPTSNYILDRAWLSDYFYPIVRRHESCPYQPFATVGLDAHLSKLFRVIYVWVWAEWSAVLPAHREELEEMDTDPNSPGGRVLSLQERHIEHETFRLTGSLFRGIRPAINHRSLLIRSYDRGEIRKIKGFLRRWS